MSDFTAFQDVHPIEPQTILDDEIAKIKYPQRYIRLMELFRTFRMTNELSERSLQLTTLIIHGSPSFYPAWNFRLSILDTLFDMSLKTSMTAEKKDDFWEVELCWLNSLTEDNLKSYQVWQHRQNIALRVPRISTRELDVLDAFLLSDAKNYHLWSYRIWLVKTYDLWDGELARLDAIIAQDHFNNSAWNYRYFLVFSHFFQSSLWSLEEELRFISRFEHSETNMALKYYRKSLTEK